MPYLKSFIIFLIFSVFSGKAQEKNISVPFDQPPKLRIDAGADLVLPDGQPVTLGNDLVIEGGTPEFSFTWTRPGNIQDTGQTISVDVPGLYRVQVIDSNSCSSVDSLLVTSFTATGGISPGHVLHLYPNPSDGVVYFRTPVKQVPISVEIIAASGSVLFSTIVPAGETESEVCLDLGKLPAGTYVCSVIAGTRTFNEMLIIR